MFCARSFWCKSLILIGLTAFLASSAWAGQWTVLGPDGGDVRSLAYDPRNPDHIFLGTSTGVLFTSSDGGRNWTRFAQVGLGNDYVLDHIAIHPQDSKLMYVSAWSVVNQQAGDLFRTKDGGKTWESLPGMHGKSIRAMAMSISDPKVLVAGALDGVFRTKDGGNNWERISPAGHAELKNIESIAIDPRDPNIVYAGTWHLPWRTVDGGVTWQHMNKGIIDDSDVFSIIVAKDNPSVVFVSACSGIYKSEVAGEQFKKIQGIPFSARRTRVLKHDPSNSSIVYAGTTEGLWKTTDAGTTWKRVSNPEVVVNDVFVDPRDSNRVLLATDRSGVLASDNGAQSWTASNHGYTHRYVTAILADHKDPQTIYVGVVNDKEWGGVFYTRDGGRTWMQKSSGLQGRDVFSLKQSSNGALIAGTNRGVFMLSANGTQWNPINSILNEKVTSRTVAKGKKKTTLTTKVPEKGILDGRVSDVEIDGDRWLAATSSGIFTSANQGKTWQGGAVLGSKDFISVRSSGAVMVAATRTSVLVSTDKGSTWKQATLASYITNIRGVTLTPDEQILVASREGAFRSTDKGATWEHSVTGLPSKDITSIAYDSVHKRLLATSDATGVVFFSTDDGRSWQRGPDSGFPLRRISVIHGRYVAATPFDGVIVQPESEGQSAAIDTGSR
jgi:photosystem II stability/assembly factor-like uncharacterized protein